MASLAQVVLNVQQAAKSDEQPAEGVSDAVTTNAKDSTLTVDPANRSSPLIPNSYHPKTNSSNPRRRSVQSHYKRSSMSYTHTTPSERTGPPRSISFSSLPNSRVVSRTNSRTDYPFPDPEETPVAAGPSTQPSHSDNSRSPGLERTESQFRDALEYDNPDQREREREHLERIERRKFRDSRFEEWNPIKWLTDSPRDTPRDEHPHFDLGAMSESDRERGEGRPKLAHPLSLSAQPDGPPPRRKKNMPRSNSLPPTPGRQDSKDKDKRISGPRWGRLRSLLPAAITHTHSQTSQTPGSTALAQRSVNITDELIAGGLSTLMLKLWFERDEKGHRRVPILLHRLRIRISDSLHPLDSNKAVFRIECEYANGAVRWVVYRQLKEFLSLHTHYAFSNAYNRNIEALPEFPKTSKKGAPPSGNWTHPAF